MNTQEQPNISICDMIRKRLCELQGYIDKGDIHTSPYQLQELEFILSQAEEIIRKNRAWNNTGEQIENFLISSQVNVSIWRTKYEDTGRIEYWTEKNRYAGYWKTPAEAVNNLEDKLRGKKWRS